MKLFIKKIVTGGQTGADRAGLEAAKEAGIKTGGYCPKNYMTENGPDISLKSFGLVQTKSKDYNERTLLNIKHSDGTVVFTKTDKTGNAIGIGTLLTINTSKNSGKPFIINPSNKEFTRWVTDNGIKTLNIAGNRQSQNRDIYKLVFNFLKRNLLIPSDISGTDTKTYKKFENGITSIKNNHVSGSLTLLDRLVDEIAIYIKNTKLHSSHVYKNIKRNVSVFKEGDTRNMLILKCFIDEFFGKFGKVNNVMDEKKKYLDFLSGYKKRWNAASKKIADNLFKEINFIDKTIVLFSNSSSVVTVFKALAKKKIFPKILQCESNPEKEGLVQAMTLRTMGFKVNVINEKDIRKHLRKIDSAILGCDGYNDKHFLNKRGTLELMIILRAENIPVYVLSDSRKQTKGPFKHSVKSSKSLFERIPLKMITKVITE